MRRAPCRKCRPLAAGSANEADARSQRLGGQDIPLDFEVGPHTTTIDFRGYAYTREPSAISGGLLTRYDPSKPQLWHVPLHDTLVPKFTAHAPRGAYVVPAAQAAWLGERLSIHGITFDRLDKAVGGANVEAFRVSEIKLSPATFEGHTTAKIASRTTIRRPRGDAPLR